MRCNTKLDMKFLNPFLTATVDVLRVQAFTDSKCGQVYLKQDLEKMVGDISGIIGIVSDQFSGSVSITFPENTYLNLMMRMLGERIYSYDGEIRDGAGEIVNMIFGKAKIVLNNSGFDFQTALPSVVTGKNHRIVSPNNCLVVVIPFDTDIGKFFVEIGVSD